MWRQVLVTLGALGLGLLLAYPAGAAEPELVPMRVIVNTVDKGDHFVYLTEDRKVWFPAKEFRDFGIIASIETKEIEGAPYVLLDALAPGITYKLDLKALLVTITTSTDQLDRHVYDLAPSRTGEAKYPDRATAYLNYSISDTVGDQQEFVSRVSPYELAISLGHPLLYSSFLYKKDTTTRESRRLVTNLTWDQPDWVTRFTLGDVYANSGELGSANLVGGFGIATEPSLNPYQVRHPGIDVSGAATTPSKVQVLINNLPVFSRDVPPGPFEIRNLPYAVGGGDARIVIRDAFGRERTLIVPYYNSQALLKAGYHDFGYFAGYLRQNIDAESEKEYGDPAYYAFHRYGFFDWLNGGLRAEGDKHLRNYGVNTRFLIGLWGELSAAYSTSDYDGIDGISRQFSYQYAGSWLSLSAVGRTMSRDYSTVEVAPEDDKSRLQWTGSIGLNAEWLGSLALQQTRDERYIDPIHTTTNLTYSRKLTGNSMVLFRATRDVEYVEPEPQTELSVAASVLVFFGIGRTAGLSQTRTTNNDDETVRETRLRYDQAAPAGTGFGYSAQVVHDTSQEVDRGYGGEATVQYNSRWAELGFEHRRAVGLDNSTLRLAGSFALIDGGLYPSRPITDSFALVRVPNLKGVRVKSAFQEVGETNGDGELLVPNLVAYGENTIGIDQRDIPFEFEVPRLEARVSPWHRGGAVVNFAINRVQAFIGTLYLVSKEKERTPAELAGLEIELPDRKESVIIGKGGEFYLENVPPGSYKARVFSDKLDCRFTLDIPQSNETIVDLGEHTCNLD